MVSAMQQTLYLQSLPFLPHLQKRAKVNIKLNDAPKAYR